MIKILYFASLRERIGCSSEDFDLPAGITTIIELKQSLSGRGADWKQAFDSDSNVLAAVNQQLADNNSIVSDGDEIAFYPPVTGG